MAIGHHFRFTGNFDFNAAAKTGSFVCVGHVQSLLIVELDV
ncbi:hypothetical protein MRBBS_2037 [Marinobacter sp. BSs20148]|nr:hypothetical protein MRBBS_2037 [Marinobacter sp. BSs20148]